MPKILILKNLYGKTVTSIKAYGTDKFDFTPNLLGVDFSVGQYGYVAFEFGDDRFYVSVDGISSIVPPKRNITALKIPERVQNTFLGAVLQSVSFDREQYYIQFEGLELLRGYYEPNDGHTDRSYFELNFPWV
jgi:hypothetical protein